MAQFCGLSGREFVLQKSRFREFVDVFEKSEKSTIWWQQKRSIH